VCAGNLKPTLIGGLPVDLALALHARVGFFPRDFLPAVVGVVGISFCALGSHRW
jgi:isochorismate synthase EntC